MARWIVAFLVSASLALQNPAMAAPLPPSPIMGQYISSAIALKAGAKAAGVTTDTMTAATAAALIGTQQATPGHAATVAAVSAGLTGLATAAVAAASAPLWLTVAGTVALTVAVPLAVDALDKYLFNRDGTITPASSIGSGSSGTTYKPQYFWGSHSGTSQFFFSVLDAANFDAGRCTLMRSDDIAYWQYCRVNAGFDPANTSTWYIEFGDGSKRYYPNGRDYQQWVLDMGGAFPASVPTGSYLDNRVPVPVSAGPAPIKPADLPQLVKPEDLEKPANPQLVADAANRAWQAAASAGTSIPFDPANPITPNDIKLINAATPVDSQPKVKDLLASPMNTAVNGAGSTTVTVPTYGAIGTQSGTGSTVGSGTATGSGAISTPMTGTQTTTSTATNQATGAVTTTTSTSTSLFTLDWGNFIFPELSVPTVGSILDPIFNMFPEWSNFALPAHSSVCPTPSFFFFGQDFAFVQLCDWVERVRVPLQAAFGVSWAAAILFVILGA